MEPYKIASLTIKNFKCFENVIFDFSSNNLVVFDGPNGYGKTTAFEALEILLTKTPRKLTKVKLDKRYKYKNSPIHKFEDLPIEISAIFHSETEQNLSLKRVIPSASTSHSKKNNIGLIFNESILYINDEESTEQALEETLQFKNIHNLFNVLNYVEQDENTYFLKEDPKERYKALISLLGGNEERVLYDKSIEFCRKISEKLHQINTDISTINAQNNETLNEGPQDLEYRPLIQSLSGNLPWDSEQINNTNLDLHNSYIAEIKKIEDLFEKRNIIETVLIIRRLNDVLNNTSLLNSLVDTFWSIQNFVILEEEDKKRTENTTLISEYSSILDLINNNRYSEILANKYLSELEAKSEKPAIDFNLFRTQVILIVTLKESLSTQNQILSDLKDKRESLNKLIEEHRNFINLKDTECPTCGYNWDSIEKLKTQVEETEVKIFSSYVIENEKFEAFKLRLEKDYLNIIKSYIQVHNEMLKIENETLIDAGRFEFLKNNYQRLNSLSIAFLTLFTPENRQNIVSLINIRAIENVEITISKITEIIKNAKPQIDDTINIEQINTDFNLYFSGNLEEIRSLVSEDFKAKQLYIQHQYYNAINQTLQNLIKRKEKLEHLYEEVNNISKKIDHKIREYTKSIVEKISIPFYIFTGKILQNHTLGSGLLLILDIDKENSQIYIRPKHRDQEVTYTLSSGQLAATVISLMLVLNKVFNNSKLGTIFIDDPLQTLDEINSHSLVELLKYNFSDQQIILSTHEDRYSQFIQYKFNKFNLSNKSLRLKDLT